MVSASFLDVDEFDARHRSRHSIFVICNDPYICNTSVITLKLSNKGTKLVQQPQLSGSVVLTVTCVLGRTSSGTNVDLAHHQCCVHYRPTRLWVMRTRE